MPLAKQCARKATASDRHLLLIEIELLFGLTDAAESETERWSTVLLRGGHWAERDHAVYLGSDPAERAIRNSER